MTVSGPTHNQFAKLLIVCLISYLVHNTHDIFGPSVFYVDAATSELIAALDFTLVTAITMGVVKNARMIQDRVGNFVGPGMEEIHRGILRKSVMLVVFNVVTGLFYLCCGVFMMVMPLIDITDRTREIWNGVNTILHWAAVTAITMIFHPCFFTAAFQLSQVEVPHCFRK